MPLDPLEAEDDTDSDPGTDTDAVPRGHVIVSGLGELGLSVVEQLRLSGVDVVLVDNGSESRLRAVAESWSVQIIDGSARDSGVLKAARLDEARAVVCVEDNDLDTLETALAARALRPEVRVVVQMANSAVARALRGVTGAGTALDVSELAAPSIVQACLGQSEHELVLSNERFRTTEVIATADASLRTLYGDLVPIAVVPAGGGDTAVCPGRDHLVATGDRVMLLGTLADLEAIDRGGERVVRRRQRRALIFAGDLGRALWGTSGRGLQVAFVALVGLVIVSSFVVHFGYETGHGHLGFVSSLYFIVETVATVGYGDFSFGAQSVGMQIFAIIMMVLGVGLVTTMFALLTNFLVSRTLAQALGSSASQRMHGHVVVVGLGSIGLRVVERLNRFGHSAVVIERDEDNRNLAQVRALRVPIILGDATLPATLDEANVRAAAAVAVVTSSDLTNLETAISLGDYLRGHDVSPPVIIRIFDRSLAQTIEHGFKLRYVRSPTALAAPYFVGAALGLDIVLTFTVEHERLLVGRLTVAPEGGLAGLEMQQLSARIRVIAILRADATELEHPPRRNTRFAPGDRAYLVGPYEELLTVLRRDARQPTTLAEITESMNTDRADGEPPAE